MLSSMAPISGFVHFDVSEGAIGENLCSALEAFLPPVSNEVPLSERTKGLMERLCTGVPEEHPIKKTLLRFARLIETLDPSFITATPLPMALGDPFLVGADKGLALQNLEGIPSHERLWPCARSDLAAILILKHVVSHFGPRGYSKILKISEIQTPEDTPQITRAFLCENPPLGLIGSHDEEFLKLTGLVGSHVNLEELSARLHGLGAKSIYYTQVQQSKAALFKTQTHIQVLCHTSDQKTLSEALLVTGEMEALYHEPVTEKSLQQTITSVPYQRGQKTLHCRVVEWRLDGKVVRAEASSEDVEDVAREFGFSREVIRADILHTWRNWKAN